MSHQSGWTHAEERKGKRKQANDLHSGSYSSLSLLFCADNCVDMMQTGVRHLAM